MKNDERKTTDSARSAEQNNISKIQIDVDELRTRIDEVLFYKWDPIGFSNSNGPRDEYGAYVEPILEMLVEGATVQAIGEKLTLFVGGMCLIRSIEKNYAIAELLHCIAHDQEYYPDHTIIELD